MNSLIQFKKATPIFIAAALACVAVSPEARAVLPAPTPDGAYPGWNTAEGSGALFNLTTGGFNTAIGAHALYGNTNGTANTAVGAFALGANSSGVQNVAIGQGALRNNTTGANNTADGSGALSSNTTGNFNTATGVSALASNTTGHANTAHGAAALNVNTTGADNTATGFHALFSNTTGRGNAATGAGALLSNIGGNGNTAVGTDALVHNVIGNGNTANGANALFNNTTGVLNTAIGTSALGNNTTGRRNTGLGVGAGVNVTTASNVTCIGANVFGEDVSNTTWLGNVYGVTTQSGTTAPVVVSDGGQLGTVASSERFKKDIAAMDKSSEAIMSLRPVTFHYKTDTKGTPQFGLIAEEVAKVNPAPVLPDKEGKPYTVRYDAVNAMLLNEFLKEHQTVQEQGATIARLEKQIEALTAGLQKVSAQLELSKPAPQTVKNNQ